MREWLKNMEEIDRDCVHQYEYLLGRKLNNREEYVEIDGQVNEMILEWENRKEFFKTYPNLKRYCLSKDKEMPVNKEVVFMGNGVENKELLELKYVGNSTMNGPVYEVNGSGKYVVDLGGTHGKSELYVVGMEPLNDMEGDPAYPFVIHAKKIKLIANEGLELPENIQRFVFEFNGDKEGLQQFEKELEEKTEAGAKAIKESLEKYSGEVSDKEKLKDLLFHEASFRYQLLYRLQMDCDYYLGYGNRYVGRLYFKTEKEHVTYMKALWESFSKDGKPEWLTWEKLMEYEKEMTGKGITVVLVEIDYKGDFKRYALTQEEFQQEFEKRLEEMPAPDMKGQTFTFRPMVHIWYQQTEIGSELWNTFFTDMEFGMSKGDIENGNLAYVEMDSMLSLRKFLKQIPGFDAEKPSLEGQIQAAAVEAAEVHTDSALKGHEKESERNK